MYNDATLAYEVIQKNGLALVLLGNDLKDSFNVVRAAIRQNPLALQYASDHLKNDGTLMHEVGKRLN